MPPKNKKPLVGFCYFHSETGTEGGYWAFQDSKFIKKNVPYPYCKKCGKWLGPQKYKNLKIVQVLPSDQKNIKYKKMEVKVDQKAIYDKNTPECPKGQHERESGDSWSYKGLHILKSGDKLTIFSRHSPKRVVWSGIISLHQLPLFTEDAYGLWIHTDQENIARDVWATYFLKEHPAELIPFK